MELTESLRQQILNIQRAEITEHHIYTRLGRRIDSPENARVLNHIAAEELAHYHKWKAYTGQDVFPRRWVVWGYSLLNLVFGFTFGIKLMERSEESAQGNYARLIHAIPEAADILQEENQHEEQLMSLLDEERLQYAGSVVLGLNDALVELTGALAGLTLALQNVRLIALSGLITGIAAALSMAASEYLSVSAEKTDKHPVRAAVYTGIAYILTVTVLILPYLLFSNYYLDLALTLLGAIAIIAGFNYYISVAQDENFRARFLEMAGLSLAVALFSFGIGYLIRVWLGVEI